MLDLYRQHPHTTGKLRSADRSLANDLYRKSVGLETIEAALVLVAARRSRMALPSNAIRSLHYFLPAIREVLEHPLDDAYLTYLKEFSQQQTPSDHHLP